MNIKDYLKQIKRLTIRVEQIGEEITEIEARLGVQGINYNKMPVTPSPDDKRSRYIYKLIDLRDEYTRESERLMEKRKEVVDSIALLEDVRLQQVLYFRYVKDMRWEEIAERLSYDDKYIFRLHGYALLELKKILKETIDE